MQFLFSVLVLSNWLLGDEAASSGFIFYWHRFQQSCSGLLSLFLIGLLRTDYNCVCRVLSTEGFQFNTFIKNKKQRKTLRSIALTMAVLCLDAPSGEPSSALQDVGHTHAALIPDQLSAALCLKTTTPAYWSSLWGHSTVEPLTQIVASFV